MTAIYRGSDDGYSDEGYSDDGYSDGYAPTAEDFMFPEEDSSDTVEDYPEDDDIIIEPPAALPNLDEQPGDGFIYGPPTNRNIGDGLHSSQKVAPEEIQQRLLWAVHNRLRIECNKVDKCPDHGWSGG